jgi:hypothetical protein
MQLPDPPLNASECAVCRAPREPDSAFCSVCGTEQKASRVEELRAILYLLSELERWQADATVSPLEAETLRRTYEQRRDALRALLASKPEQDKPFPFAKEELRSDARRVEPYVTPAEISQTLHASSVEDEPVARRSSIRFPLLRQTPGTGSSPTQPRRTIAENLAEPYTLRLLLYTGAAMFVVGVVIWLRDVLYLKLQEPLVQAALLITGTIALTAAGWYTILRTRQRFTGRALTLSGSLLVPVNFWFLVRSGLIANRGRAWVVCALCTLLYAHTAALLRERLYVYLAAAASVATGWAIVYRAERNAPGLYALVLMIASLVFLHLSRIFPARDEAGGSIESAPEQEARAGRGAGTSVMGRWSRELWSEPLVQAALTGATLCALLYMPLRLGTSSSLYDGIFRLRARDYDSSTAILLFTGVAYVAWFTGRYVEVKRRVSFYAASALALLWTEFLILDGLRLNGTTQILTLAATALAVSVAARRARQAEQSRALYIAGVFVSVLLAPVAFSVLFGAETLTFMQSAGFALLALDFAVLSAPRLCERAAQKAFSYLAAILASTSFLVALASLSLRSVTLITAACAAWPFVLYGVGQSARRLQRETQLITPFVSIADVEFVLLLLWASVVAFALFLSGEELALSAPRAAMFCALSATLIYGLWRASRERSAYGATLAAVSAVVMTASLLDALEHAGVWPANWPIAAGVIGAAFVLHKAGARWLHVERADAADGAGLMERMVRLVLDAAVVLCALLWFTRALVFFDRGNWSAACVLLLALLYWSEHAVEKRAIWALHLALMHVGAFFLALLIALGINRQWYAALFALVLAPALFALAGYARARAAAWLSVPVSAAGLMAMALAALVSVLQAMQHLQAGDPLLLAPAVTTAGLALLSFVVSLLSAGQMRVRLFRAGLYLTVIAYALLCLRSGFEPLTDIEVYTSPVAILLLVVAYISFRRAWNDYERDTSLLFWTGSILLAGPLLLRALQYRLLLDEPAPSHDLATLGASLALLLFGVMGRLRAPVLVGATTLIIELAALALTSVDWLQVPLKIYLVTVGALLALVGWMFEYRREQLIVLRARLNTQRETARERFGEWR